MVTIAADAGTKNAVLTLHRGFFAVFLIYALFMAVWGLFLFLLGRNPSGGYTGALILMEGVTVLQGIIGLILVVTGHRPHDSLHYLYGIIGVVTLPTAYFLSDNATTRRDSLIFGLAGLFLVGVAIRGATTGAG